MSQPVVSLFEEKGIRSKSVSWKWQLVRLNTHVGSIRGDHVFDSGIFFNLGDEDSIQRHMQTEWFGLNETQASREAMNEGNGENIVVRIFNSCSLGDDDEIESDNDDDQNKLMKRRSSQVKFGQAEVLPNISIEPVSRLRCHMPLHRSRLSF